MTHYLHYRQNTEQEIKNWIQLDHPNLVKYRNVVFEGNKLFIVSEPIDGIPLNQFLLNQRQPLEEQFVIKILYQLSSALYYLHENNIPHLDINTKNILITKGFDAVIIDFGISWVIGISLDCLNFNATNYFYLSPEMIKNKSYSFSTDIWSLDCVLYEMITQKHPFGDNVFEICQNIEMENMIPIVSDYSDDLRSLIKLMLVKVPSYRIQLRKILRLEFVVQTVGQSYDLRKTGLPKKSKGDVSSFLNQKSLVEDSIDSIRPSPRYSRNVESPSRKKVQVKEPPKKGKRSTSVSRGGQQKGKQMKDLENTVDVNQRTYQTSTKKLPSSPQQNDPVQEGMRLLREKFDGKPEQQRAFSLFQHSADQNDTEACWRCAAFCLQGVRSMEGGSVDGTFWYAHSMDTYEEKYPVYLQAAQRGHLASKWWVGFCQAFGSGTLKMEEEGLLKMDEVAQSGDGYWAREMAKFLGNGHYNLRKDLQKAQSLKHLAKRQAISDCSVFNPAT